MSIATFTLFAFIMLHIQKPNNVTKYAKVNLTLLGSLFARNSQMMLLIVSRNVV